MYTGVSPMGFGKFCGLWTPSEQYNDGFARGLQHLFYKGYQMDLVNMAITMTTFDDGLLEYGNVYYNGDQCPRVHHDVEDFVENGYCYNTTSFRREDIKRTTKGYAMFEYLVIEETYHNLTDQKVELDAHAFFFPRTYKRSKLKYDVNHDCVIWKEEEAEDYIVVGLEEASTSFTLSKEQRHFALGTIQKLMDREQSLSNEIESQVGLSTSLTKHISIEANCSYTFRWFIIPSSDGEKGISMLKEIRKTDVVQEAQTMYADFLKPLKKYEDILDKKTFELLNQNMVALKAVLSKGLVPADVTGHYFSWGNPTFYVRDSLMVARAFLNAGYGEEAKSIIKRYASLPMKGKGEFYQRYNNHCEGDEGANNGVDHQLDANGYFISLIVQYYRKYKELLIEPQFIIDILHFLNSKQTYKGLIGPEGGVNEGVYGASYITSTNMFILGGLNHLLECLTEGDAHTWATPEEYKELKSLSQPLIEGIKSGISLMWNEEKGFYNYGYSETLEMTIKRYDTPQYFSLFYGYKNDERFTRNNTYLLQNASFYDGGMGYSQQSYHSGAWLFNTGASAQYQYLYGDKTVYDKQIKFMIDHANGFGLMVEAVDGVYENLPLINPLSWACAEFVNAITVMKV